MIEIFNYAIPNEYIYGIAGILGIQIIGAMIYMVVKKKKPGRKPKVKTEEVLSEIYICTTCGVPCSTTKRLIEHNLAVHNLQLSDADARVKTDAITLEEFNELVADEKETDRYHSQHIAEMQDRIDNELTRPKDTEPMEIVPQESIAKSTPDMIYSKAMENMAAPGTNIPLRGYSTIDMEGDLISFVAQFKVLNTPENMEILSQIGRLKRI